jgi:hypothetical protein
MGEKLRKLIEVAEVEEALRLKDNRIADLEAELDRWRKLARDLTESNKAIKGVQDTVDAARGEPLP